MEPKNFDIEVDALNKQFEFLNNKYQSALKEDLEFIELKKIYIDLKQIHQKLSELRNRK